jgi:uncharacterized protein YjbI with pentapeptide repeats
MEIQVFLNKISFLRISIFIFPLILIISTTTNSPIFESDYYSYSVFFKEDGLFENATSFFYFLSFFFSVLISYIFFKTDKKIFGKLYLIFGIVFLIVGFEEISWGQRIFDFETPDVFYGNLQNELNLHNFVQGKSTLWVFAAIGFFGGFAWLFFPKKKNISYNSFVRYFIPKWFLSIFFIPVFFFMVLVLYNSLNEFEHFISINIFSSHSHEFYEFLLSAGVFLFVFSVFFKLKFIELKNIESENKREKISIKGKIIITCITIFILFSIIIFIYLTEPYFLLTILFGHDLSNLDLSNVDLSGKDLSGTILTGTNLANSNLSNVDLSGKDLSRTILTGTNLANSNLSNVDLSGKDLSGTNLSRVDLSGKDLSRTILTGANLTNANLSNAILTQANLTNANLINANLSNAIILGAIMNGVNLENAILKEANLQGTFLINANLKDSDLTKAKLMGAHLNNANLQNASFYYANLVIADMSDANLLNTKLENANLKGAILSCVNHPICN